MLSDITTHETGDKQRGVRSRALYIGDMNNDNNNVPASDAAEKNNNGEEEIRGGLKIFSSGTERAVTEL